MACIKDFDPLLLPTFPNCPCPTYAQPWAMQGVVSWLGDSLTAFDLEIEQNVPGIKKENFRFNVRVGPLPGFLAVGNTVRVSFDGEKSRIELVNKA